MRETKRLPLGAGLTLVLNAPIPAAPTMAMLAVTACAHVAAGGLLRLDAKQGRDVAAHLEPDAWYGTVEGLPAAFGPFARKSQAMNATVLTLMHLTVEPARAAPPADGPTADLRRALIALGVPPEVADALCRGEGLPG